MPYGYAYHRLPGGKQKQIYHCKQCGERTEEIVKEGAGGNQYTRSGLCRACFEVRVEAMLREEVFPRSQNGGIKALGEAREWFKRWRNWDVLDWGILLAVLCVSAALGMAGACGLWALLRLLYAVT